MLVTEMCAGWKKTLSSSTYQELILFKNLVIIFCRFAKNLKGSVTLIFSVRILVYSIFPQSFL